MSSPASISLKALLPHLHPSCLPAPNYQGNWKTQQAILCLNFPSLQGHIFCPCSSPTPMGAERAGELQPSSCARVTKMVWSGKHNTGTLPPNPPLQYNPLETYSSSLAEQCRAAHQLHCGAWGPTGETSNPDAVECALHPH